MARSVKSPDYQRYWKYSKHFHHLVDVLSEIHKEKRTIELSYLNGIYWCPLLDFDARDCVSDYTLSLQMKVRIVSHSRTLLDDFQDAKVGLLIGPYTMLATVGEIERKKKKDKSYHYELELNWT